MKSSTTNPTTEPMNSRSTASFESLPRPVKIPLSSEWTTGKKNILVILTNNNWSNAMRYAKSIQDRDNHIVGFLNDEVIPTTPDSFGLKSIGKIQDLSLILETHPVDAICITQSSFRQDQILRAIRIADYYGVRVNLVPENPNYIRNQSRYSTVGDLPVVPLRQIPLDNRFNAFIKRAFDFLFALMVIILLSPVYLIIGLLIYLDGHGPVIYAPIRKGEGNGNFSCFKFRTMSECDNPVNGRKSTEKDDPRITRIGRYLRKYDLDELPQFFNVLEGEMSVVGPRPHRTILAQDFRKTVNDYMVRHYVKPGITGWAQVNGWRGPTETLEQKQQRVRHDLWYIENWNFFLDLKIIILTVTGKRARKNAF